MGRLLIISLLLLAVPACGPRPANVSGVWIGTWVSADGESTGRFRVEVSQRGKAIKGPIELSLDWLPHARIEGVVEGQRVRWGVLRGGLVVLTFEGTVSGDTAAGRYSFGQAGEGSWIARRERRHVGPVQARRISASSVTRFRTIVDASSGMLMTRLRSSAAIAA